MKVNKVTTLLSHPIDPTSTAQASVFMLDLGALSFSCWGLKPYMSYIFSVFLWPGRICQSQWHSTVNFLDPGFHLWRCKCFDCNLRSAYSNGTCKPIFTVTMSFHEWSSQSIHCPYHCCLLTTHANIIHAICNIAARYTSTINQWQNNDKHGDKSTTTARSDTDKSMKHEWQDSEKAWIDQWEWMRETNDRIMTNPWHEQWIMKLWESMTKSIKSMIKEKSINDSQWWGTDQPMII